MKSTQIRSKIEPDRWARRAHVRKAVFRRDGHCLLGPLVGDCMGPPSYHHRRKAGASGAYTVENGAMLCVGHNGWIEDTAAEDWPSAAIALYPYLVVREGDDEWDALSARTARKSCPTCEGTRFGIDGGACRDCHTIATSR